MPAVRILLPALLLFLAVPPAIGNAGVSNDVVLVVPSGDPAGAAASLLPGLYRVRASGTYVFNAAGDAADAEYIFTAARSCVDLNDPAHSTNGDGDQRYDLQDSVPDFSIRQWGTACDALTHTYGPTREPNVGVENYRCDDAVCPVRFWVVDPASYADNVGSLTVRFTKIG